VIALLYAQREPVASKCSEEGRTNGSPRLKESGQERDRNKAGRRSKMRGRAKEPGKMTEGEMKDRCSHTQTKR